MSARTVATDTRSLRYVLAQFSKVVAVITFLQKRSYGSSQTSEGIGGKSVVTLF